MSRQYWTFIVTAEPATMERNVRIEPTASVEKPVRPCPMVHPRAVTPPKPIRMPPSTWFAVSAGPADPSPREGGAGGADGGPPPRKAATPAAPAGTTPGRAGPRNDGG